MAAQKYSYSVYDRFLEKDICVNASAIDVSRTTGISPSKVGLYAENKWVYDKKYLFRKTYIPNGETMPQMEDLTEKEPKHQEKKEVVIPPELSAEWDRARFILNPKARIVT